MNGPRETASDGAMAQAIRVQLRASMALTGALLDDRVLLGQLEQLARDCAGALAAGGKIIFAGNGGSFADAQHLSAAYTTRFQRERGPLASLALGCNNAALSAIGNDYGYEQVFARELRGIAAAHDVFIALTTSGNSANIVAAAASARELGVRTVGMTGQGGGRLGEQCDCLRIPSTVTPRIQECHVLLGHILCGLVEDAMRSSHQC